MECPNCNMEVQAGSTICPSCKTLLSKNVGKLGSPARRLIAYFIDYIVYIILFFITFLEPIVAVLLIGLGIVQLYMLTQSTSFGKRILGMRVYSKEGKRVGFLKMLLRESIGKIISGLIFSLGYIWILIDDENQAWHDKLIDSVVIQEK